MKRKVCCLLLAILFVFGLIGCSKSSNEEAFVPTKTEKVEQTEKEKEEEVMANLLNEKAEEIREGLVEIGLLEEGERLYRLNDRIPTDPEVSKEYFVKSLVVFKDKIDIYLVSIEGANNYGRYNPKYEILIDGELKPFMRGAVSGDIFVDGMKAKNRRLYSRNDVVEFVQGSDYIVFTSELLGERDLFVVFKEEFTIIE